MKKILLSLLILVSSLSCQTTKAPSSNKVIKSAEERSDFETAEAVGQKFAIATQGKYASLAAQEMFKLGGNIIDAAIAASFTISVERPQSTGIGGGGFMLFYEAKTGKTHAIDFRERAPLKARSDMYIKNGKVDELASKDGYSAVAVPGLVAGLIEIHKRFGSLPLKAVVKPAIDLAQKGFAIYPEYHQALSYKAATLRKDPAASKIFLTPQGEVPPLGAIVVQKELAQTLQLISENGADEFYKGAIAKSLIRTFQRKKALITQKDFDSYKVHWRTPVEATYKEFKIASMPPPSSGGIHVIQFLKFLEGDSVGKYGPLSAQSIHLAASALQSSFADRARYLGDPDFVSVPTQELISESYLKKRRQEITISKARSAAEVKAGMPLPVESTETTHLSIMDADGNAVSTTQTINGWFGASVVAPGTGIVLNNEMDDFTAKVGESNLFGAIGGKPNLIEPQKTPLSSMSPTLIFKNNEAIMSLGAPGGTRIISCVAQTVLNYIEFKLPLYESVAMVRYHHQWQPDVLFIDKPGPTLETMTALKDMGYKTEVAPIPCKVMAVAKEKNLLRGVSDPRDIGTGLAE